MEVQDVDRRNIGAAGQEVSNLMTATLTKVRNLLEHLQLFDAGLLLKREPQRIGQLFDSFRASFVGDDRADYDSQDYQNHDDEKADWRPIHCFIPLKSEGALTFFSLLTLSGAFRLE